MVKVIANTLFKSTTNVLFPTDGKDIWLVDCGDDKEVIDFVRSNDYIITGILLTHGHFDHIYGLNEIISNFPNAKVYTSAVGASMICHSRKNMSHYWGNPFVFSFPDNIVTVEDGDLLEIGEGIIANAIFTPGHNPSCITWVINDMIFTGDSFIPGVKTVTNLPGGDKRLSEDSLALIHKLAIGRKIYPGHLI